MTNNSNPSQPAATGASNSGNSSSLARTRQPLAASGHLNQQQQQPNYLCPSTVFQQVKQTQASLARLTRVHQQLSGQQNQSSHHHQLKQQQQQPQQQQASRSTTFVDCLIRRFKDCFNEDCCTVPMFVVGNLSPGSDGTHLILPPCVSLGGQNIGRFVGPKNMRLINSIRESCKSIEELDLGGNKLNDLIEVYKILQCTPNLKFLNLSENDLSRSWPVAMAHTTGPAQQPSSALSTASPVNPAPPVSAAPSAVNPSQHQSQHHHHQQHWAASSMALNSSSSSSSPRTCLGPLTNQDQQQQAIGSRRHSTLGQPTAAASSPQATSRSPGGGGGLPHHQRATRVAEARRLAAAAALAQSKKTSSSVASKLTNSAASAAVAARQASGARRAGAGAGSGQEVAVGQTSPSTRPRQATAGQASTMHLARSLSSLSAKEVRAATSSRLASHRTVAASRRASNLRVATASRAQQNQATAKSQSKEGHQEPPVVGGSSGSGTSNTSTGISKSSVSNQKPPKQAPTTIDKTLFIEPIDESDDVDMSAGEQPQQQQQLSPDLSQPVTTVSSSSPPSSSAQHLSRLSSKTQTTTTTTTNYRRTFGSIKALALNNTGCQWRVVCSILSRMPNLEELHLSLNNYERIDLDPNEFKHLSLKRLYLCNNPKLTNWEELDKLLMAFPSLEALSIADCNISQIPENLDRSRGWRKICGLNINGWPIKEWPVIERLNQLPSLVDLKCRNLEILNTIDEPRHHLIARLPKLQRLNGSEIEEREHAEKAFLRFFMANSHLERPSRFHELIQIHGEVLGPVDVDVDLSPPSHASVRVVFLNKKLCRNENDEDIFMSEDFLAKLMDNVEPPGGPNQVATTNNVVQQQQQQNNANTSNLENMNEADGDGPVRLFKDDCQEVVAIDVDLRQSVRKFKSTLATLFGLTSQNDVILYYIDHEMVGLMGPELIKHNQKKLWNYNVQDGDQFIVEER